MGISVATAALALVAIGLLVTMLTAPLEAATAGWLGIALMGALLLLGVPVAAAMGVAGIAGIFALQGALGVQTTMARLPYDAVASWPLTVIPMFILMGLLLWRSGATAKLYQAAREWLGWLPGGLAITTNSAGAALGAASGSTLGIAYALGRIGIPSMLAAGYPKRMALASVLMSGSAAQLIPPSILLVVYAGVASTAVDAQLLAGIVPGLLLTTIYTAVLIAWSAVAQRHRGHRFDTTPTSWPGRRRALAQAWPIPALILTVVGGIYFGIFTATEAGAVGAAVSLVIAVYFLRGKAGRAIWDACRETAASVGAIFFLLVGAAVLSRFLALTGLTTDLASSVLELGLTPVQFLLLLIVFYLVLGMFMEPVSMMMLTVPVLLPVLSVLEIDIIWFGVFVVLMGELAQVTPPVGLLLYVVHRLAQDKAVNLGNSISLRDVMRASLWFVPPAILMAVLLIVFPGMVSFLTVAR